MTVLAGADGTRKPRQSSVNGPPVRSRGLPPPASAQTHRPPDRPSIGPDMACDRPPTRRHARSTGVQAAPRGPLSPDQRPHRGTDQGMIDAQPAFMAHLSALEPRSEPVRGPSAACQPPVADRLKGPAAPGPPPPPPRRVPGAPGAGDTNT